MPNEQWYIKQAYKDNYWEHDNFADFLRWYADPDRKNAIQKGNGDRYLDANDIIDIVDQPWKTHLRDQYYIYLRNTYDE